MIRNPPDRTESTQNQINDELLMFINVTYHVEETKSGSFLDDPDLCSMQIGRGARA